MYIQGVIFVTDMLVLVTNKTHKKSEKEHMLLRLRMTMCISVKRLIQSLSTEKKFRLVARELRRRKWDGGGQRTRIIKEMTAIG